MREMPRPAHGPAAHPPAPGTLEAALLAASRDGRIACPAAFAVAGELGVPVPEAGRAIERLGLKIAGCQLGCFR